MKALIILFATTGALLFGQTSGTSFSGPALGFVMTETLGELLPIRGVAGAARIGDPIWLPNTVTRIYIAPGHLYALAAQGDSDSVASAAQSIADPLAVVVLRGAGGVQVNPLLTPLAGARRPDLVAFSPSGAAAALYSSETNRVQIFTGLPNTPQLTWQIAVPAIAGQARALAVSDDAQAALIADATGTVSLLSSNGSAGAIYHAAQVSSLAFIAGSHDAIVCDPVSGFVAILPGGASGEVRVYQSPSDKGCAARAAASTGDGSTILVACSDQHFVWSIDRTTGATFAYNVNTNVTALDRLGAKDAFLLSPADNNGTYWVVKWEANGPVMSFIGAARSK